MAAHTDTPGGSRTALVVAWLRAAHQVLDAEPKILTDPVAVTLAGLGAEAAIREQRAKLEAPESLGWRSHVVLRSRYAEDRLAAAAARGAAQCVVLGAGYDTFAYRQPPWAGALRIFEVDRADTQAEKRAALARAGIGIPDNVRFVPIDFEREAIDATLAAAGFDRTLRTFVSWLGVMVYVTDEAADAVFRFVASLPSGSELVFSFAPRDDPQAARSAYLQRTAEAVAALGEPCRTFTDPADLDRRLRACGFSGVSLLSPEEAAVRYFSDRADGLRPPRRANIAAAIV